MSSAHLT